MYLSNKVADYWLYKHGIDFNDIYYYKLNYSFKIKNVDH